MKYEEDFKEQFPSVWNEFAQQAPEYPEDDYPFADYDFVATTTLMKHCLDRQRVREVIEQLEQEYYKYGEPEDVEPCVLLARVINELGLEDD